MNQDWQNINKCLETWLGIKYSLPFICFRKTTIFINHHNVLFYFTLGRFPKEKVFPGDATVGKRKRKSVAKYILKCFCTKCFYWRISQTLLKANAHYKSLSEPWMCRIPQIIELYTVLWESIFKECHYQDYSGNRIFINAVLRKYHHTSLKTNVFLFLYN